MDTTTKRVKKYIALALRESTRSDYKRINIGAVIADGNYLVSRGYNSKRTHPLQNRYNLQSNRPVRGSCLHAEIAAVVKAQEYNLSGCDIFVARFDRRGNLANCRPCVACQRALSDNGIRRCYFTSGNGIEEMSIADV